MSEPIVIEIGPRLFEIIEWALGVFLVAVTLGNYRSGRNS